MFAVSAVVLRQSTRCRRSRLPVRCFATRNNSPLPLPRPTPGLAAAKEAAQHDIHDAEAHGVLKPPPPDAAWFKRTLHTAIELAKFYFRGVKLIFIRRKEIALIKSRVNAGGSPLTRAEFRLIATQRDDINKVIPFIIIALLLEEVIPVIAIYAPVMLPSTCILPSQLARIETRRSEKADTIASQNRHMLTNLRQSEKPPGHFPLPSLSQAGVPSTFCALLGLPTFGFDMLRTRRVRRRLDFLAQDDELLQNTPLSGLSHRELKVAVVERGIRPTGTSQSQLHSSLTWWLQSVKGTTPGTDEALSRRLYAILDNRSQ